MNETKTKTGFFQALPFYLVFLNIFVLIPIVMHGGWWILLGVAYFQLLFTMGDRVFGINLENLDPLTDDQQLFWYRFVTFCWPFAQAFLIFFAIWQVNHHDYALWERIMIMVLIGASSGLAGIVIAHELIHQSNRFERSLGDILLGMVLYGHFRTEHVMGHHRYVATPRDPATARYNEGLYRFFLRVVPQSFLSAWRIEKGRMSKLGLPIYSRRNPFWIYASLSGFSIILAYILGGWHGVAQFLFQALWAILLLETTNYIEHYGLVRLHKGKGKYEHVAPRHSWNANQRITNYLMINLQRHSDHHYKPARRYPLLQALDEVDAPQLPYGYLLMAMFAFSPYHWRRLMNPRVRRWRSMYYPQITDWRDYNQGTTPWPR